MSAGRRDEVVVHVDAPELGVRRAVGWLRRTGSGRSADLAFEYDPRWLAAAVFTLEPSLNLTPGEQRRRGGGLFGIFSDAAPDYWGRKLLERRERLIALREHRPPRTLDEWDYLLGVSDATRMGALRFSRPSGGAFLDDMTVAHTHLRVLTFSNTPGSAVQVARPLDEVDHALRRIRTLLLLIAAGGIAVAAALGLAVSQAALAPVRRLTEATETVTETGDLTGRIDARGRDEVSRLAASFNTMLGALEEAARSQRRLVADASHELRTPLTSLRTNIEVLAGERTLPPGERERLLGDVVEQLGEMTTLVAELMELARGQEQAAEPEDVRLDLVAADAVERARRNRPGVVFETELEESLVRGVPARIERAVANLLDNAAKWSPPGGTVEVTVRGGEVSVRDHGPGIDDADLPYVFDRFYRAAPARGLPGSGLGLAIVRQVAEAHGGRAVAARAEGGGTRMTLSLS